MKVEAMSAPDASPWTAPLMLVGEISHRVLNACTRALGGAIQWRFEPTGTIAFPRIPADAATLTEDAANPCRRSPCPIPTR